MPAHSMTSATTVSPEQQSALATQIHSSCENESRTALAHLSQNKSNDAARALIEAYRDCHWRDTRISILRALGRNGSERAIDFLLRTAARTEDIGVSQEAFLALGETGDPVAATFLLTRLADAPLYMKPWVVSALARVPDLRAAPALRALMNSKESAEHPQLLRNCVVALSEMKDTTILKQLCTMLKTRVQVNDHQPDATSLTLLSAIGKLSRDPSDLEEFERAFESEMLHQQYFQQCQTHVSFRQQWTLEDYLGKIFFSENIHRALPLELNSFSTHDLAEAVSLFASEDKHFNRMCTILASLLEADELYKRFILVETLTPQQSIFLLGSLALHRADYSRTLCAKIFEHHVYNHLSTAGSADIFSAWLRVIICVDADPLQKLVGLLNSKEYTTEWHEKNKVELINAFVSCSLALRKEKSWPKKLLQNISEFVHKEQNHLVLGRWIRALGELELSDLKWSDELQGRVLQSRTLQASALLMLEREDEHQNTLLLKATQSTLAERQEYIPLFLRACARLKNIEKDLPSEAILQNALKSEKSDEQLAALAYLAAHPRQSTLERVIELCDPKLTSKRTVVSAIVAARSLGHEKCVTRLEHCLTSSSKVLSGRALDALLAIEHSTARQAVVSFFTQHLADPVITDKVLRSLKAPNQGDSQLALLLEEAMHHTCNAALKDDIFELASRLRSGTQEGARSLPGTDVIRDLDKQLESKISDYARLADPIKASLRSAELPLNQPEIFEGTVDKSASVVQYCKAIDLALEKDFGQRILFPKMEQQLHVFQNILHRAELDQESPNINLVMRHLRAEHVFDLTTFPAGKMLMISRSILSGRILRERSQVIDGLKAWAVLLLVFSGHERLWGVEQMKKDPLLYQTLAQKLVALQDLRNPAAHRQTMLALAPLGEIRKEVFNVFASMKKAFE